MIPPPKPTFRRARLAGIAPARVLGAACALVLVCAAAMAWPLVAGHVRDRDARRSVRLADEALQADLVRTYLAHVLRRPPQVIAGHAVHEALYFDTRAAAFCAVDAAGPCDAQEYLAVERTGALVDAADHRLPLALQQVLDRQTQIRTHNRDPHLPGVTRLDATADNAFAGACAVPSARMGHLIRISRGVVQAPDGPALAMVLDRYCDRSGGMRVVRFNRQGTRWAVAAGD
ncbi:hypothetical protein [Stenotrophomonas sp. GZD-301]|uniref:hypothetical protein n=1 Tax=Stenotrophomonas sp. GZD-301 TaxID=3404814 RepID=UPI003BB5CA44